MATKMKLPIIVICILSIVLSIGFVYFNKNNQVVEECSTEDYSYEDYSCEDYSEESFSYEEKTEENTTTLMITLEEPKYNSSKKEPVKTMALTYSSKPTTESVTKSKEKYNDEREILAK